MPERDIYESISPIDYRYWEDHGMELYLSENAFTEYKRRYEGALLGAVARRLAQHNHAPPDAADRFQRDCPRVSTAEVYVEERRVKHDQRALIIIMATRCDPEVARLLHIPDTSWDPIGTANIARYRDAIADVLLPRLLKLEGQLIRIAIREAKQVCVGRTHRRHAVPITFGFAMAEYVERLGDGIGSLQELLPRLRGKSSGACGALNAAHVLFDDPAAFEAEVVGGLDLEPARHSTQVLHPEPLMRVFHELQLISGVIANLSRDLCQLMRDEIDEVVEAEDATQVGSSTMTHKPPNPIVYENADSLWKVMTGRYVTVLLDQLKEHQRDLSDSFSSRQYVETIAYLSGVVKKITGALGRLRTNPAAMERNLAIHGDRLLGEKLYVLLAVEAKRTDANQLVRDLGRQARQEGKTLEAVAMAHPVVAAYLDSLPPERREGFFDPHRYIGIAPQRATAVAEYWAERFNINLNDSGKEPA